METLSYWLKGIRFYIATGALLVTGFVVWWAHAAYGGTTLYPTRVEETFAWLALSLMILAVSIGPVYKLLPKLVGKSLMFDARRLIGVSAAWFATLHASIAFISLFKAANPLDLPSSYQRAFLVGAIALLVLLLMAFTSFDRAFSGMGIWWFRLHRFIYLAIGLVLLHAFMIGVHATNTPILIALSVIAAILLLMYSKLLYARRGKITRWQVISLAATAVFLILVLTYGFMQHDHSMFRNPHA